MFFLIRNILSTQSSSISNISSLPQFISPPHLQIPPFSISLALFFSLIFLSSPSHVLFPLPYFPPLYFFSISFPLPLLILHLSLSLSFSLPLLHYSYFLLFSFPLLHSTSLFLFPFPDSSLISTTFTNSFPYSSFIFTPIFSCLLSFPTYSTSFYFLLLFTILLPPPAFISPKVDTFLFSMYSR
jgi:hypothetical protein